MLRMLQPAPIRTLNTSFQSKQSRAVVSRTSVWECWHAWRLPMASKSPTVGCAARYKCNAHTRAHSSISCSQLTRGGLTFIDPVRHVVECFVLADCTPVRRRRFMLASCMQVLALCQEQFDRADNMTDRLCALQALGRLDSTAFADASDVFLASEPTENALKWLQVQATCSLPGALERLTGKPFTLMHARLS